MAGNRVEPPAGRRCEWRFGSGTEWWLPILGSASVARVTDLAWRFFSISQLNLHPEHRINKSWFSFKVEWRQKVPIRFHFNIVFGKSTT